MSEHTVNDVDIGPGASLKPPSINECFMPNEQSSDIAIASDAAKQTMKDRTFSNETTIIVDEQQPLLTAQSSSQQHNNSGRPQVQERYCCPIPYCLPFALMCCLNTIYFITVVVGCIHYDTFVSSHYVQYINTLLSLILIRPLFM